MPAAADWGGPPTSSYVAGLASTQGGDPRFPGLSGLIGSWNFLQSFTGPFAVENYNSLTSLGQLITEALQ